MNSSASIRLILPVAAAEAHHCRNTEIEPEHLFIAICRLEAVAEAAALVPGLKDDIQWVSELLDAAGLSPSGVRRRLRSSMRKQEALKGEFTGHRSERCVEVCEAAEELAGEEGDPEVGIRHFVTTLIVDASPILQGAIVALEGQWTLLRKRAGLGGAEEEGRPERVVEERPGMGPAQRPGAQVAGKGRRASRTPLLDKLGRDITAQAKEGKLAPCVGRKDEMRHIARILRRRTKNNPVLVGEPGVGKTCIVEGLAQRVAGPNAPEDLRGWRIVEVSIGGLLAGTKYRGELEERLNGLVREASSDPNLIIFIDELHTLVGAGGSSGQGMDAAQVLKPALARGEVKVIGATTVAEYRKYVESDAALERRFQMVWVNEPTKVEAVEILTGLKAAFEDHHGLQITDEAVAKAVEFSMRFLPDHRLPDKAIDLIDQACASRMLATLSPGPPTQSATDKRLDVQDIAEVVAERCRIPVGMLTTEERVRLQGIETSLRQRVMGQDHAVRKVAGAVRTARLGLTNPRRPAGVFLFLGPTGTGKTELAKALAEFLFGAEDSLIRFDMSEYKEKHEVAKLIGAPPGYIGHDEEGQLVKQVRTRPYSIVLLDEIEKAHSEVHDLFLQVFDEGRLTDAKGRCAHFTDCIIIMTSNLGCRQGSHSMDAHAAFGFHPLEAEASTKDEAAESSEAQYAEYCQVALSEVKRSFRPEFLNRIQEQIVFRPLTPDVFRAILAKLVSRLNDRLRDKAIVVRLSPEAEAKLVDHGYDDEYGARALERVFERQISDRLAAELLDGRVRDGQQVFVTASEEGYCFRADSTA